jgi:hypothetical protein
MLLWCKPETENSSIAHCKTVLLSENSVFSSSSSYFAVCRFAMTTNSCAIILTMLPLFSFSPDGCCGCPMRAVRGRLPPQHEHRRQGPEPLAAQPVGQPPLRLLGLRLHRCRAFWTVNSSPPAVATDTELRHGFRKKTIL